MNDDLHGDEPLDNDAQHDGPHHNVLASDLLSLRCVLVSQGEDPAAALVVAGIFDAVAIPVVLGDDPSLSGGILGDGRTPNLVAVLETEPHGGLNAAPDTQARQSRSAVDPSPVRSGAVKPPPGFGMKPLAPVRRSSLED